MQEMEVEENPFIFLLFSTIYTTKFLALNRDTADTSYK